MKKTVFFFLLAVAFCGILFAQGAGATTTVNGTLGLNAGSIVVRSGASVYYAMGLERWIGFIDDLKDGAQVSIEGYVTSPYMEGQTERAIYPVKLTLNGKVYDLAPAVSYGNGRGIGPGMGDPLALGRGRMGNNFMHGRGGRGLGCCIY